MSSEGNLAATSCNSAGRVLVPVAVRRDFVDFTKRIVELFGVKLEVPDFERHDVPSFKKFCGGLLEPTGRHPWAGPLRFLPAKDRLSVAGSLFSFRKLLPSADPDVVSYMESMSRPNPPSTRAFRRFVTKEVRRMFPVGWDREWRQFVRTTPPSSSASIGRSRKNGGARAELVGRREWFLKSCMGLEKPSIPTVRKVGVAPSGGKNRIVTSSPSEAVLLSPLHKLIYSRLSRFSWLLRGEADPSSFLRFTQKEGEVFVSGDYESATDNLKMDVATHVLYEVLYQARYVPRNIRHEAMSSLSVVLTDGKVSYLQRRGQLMGNYLSFPLLCLQNYLAFRYYAGDYPVRINGDDIVFRAPRHVYTRWAAGVSSTGLTLSVGKTFVHRRFFSLNSKYFCAKKEKEPSVVPIVRASCLYKPCEDPNQVAGWVNRIGEGFDVARRDSLQIAVLRRQRIVIRCAQRSVTRGLGCCVTASVVTRAGLRNWEGHYLGLPRENAPPCKKRLGDLPAGWSKVSVPLGGDDDPGFGPACLQVAWKMPAKPVAVDDYWAVVRQSSSRFPRRDSAAWRRMAKLCGLSIRGCKDWLTPVLDIRGRGKRVWRRSGASP